MFKHTSLWGPLHSHGHTMPVCARARMSFHRVQPLPLGLQHSGQTTGVSGSTGSPLIGGGMLMVERGPQMACQLSAHRPCTPVSGEATTQTVYSPVSGEAATQTVHSPGYLDQPLALHELLQHLLRFLLPHLFAFELIH